MLARTVRILVTNMVKAVISGNMFHVKHFQISQRDVSRETPPGEILIQYM